MPKYTVDRVKFFEGMEGHGFNARLLRDGKPVCEVIDDASGGPFMFRWLDTKAPEVDVTLLRYDDTPYTRKGTPEEKAFYDHLASIPKTANEYSEGRLVPMTDEVFVDELASRADLEKRVAAMVKRSFCCLRPDGQVVTWPLKKYPAEKLRAHVAAKHPDFKIINDMPIEEQVKHLSAS